jgi:CheY-like chemotaxis protein
MVSDTGIGIPDNQLPHIFDRFYQVEKASFQEHKQDGTGIGLALVRELITLHHGRIDVKSNQGKNNGTEFFIRLPMGKAHLTNGEISPELATEFESFHLHRKHHEIPPVSMIALEVGKVKKPVIDEATLETDELDPVQGKRQKNVILVVEDNSEVREYIREVLEPHYKVEEAEEGREGIAKARKIIPDLILSDVMMPEVDGYQLCRVLKQDIKTSHIPVILLTAKASEENMEQGLEIGADDYITKPFNTKILLIRVKNLIHLRRLLQQKIQRQMMMQPDEIAVSSIDQSFLKEIQELIENNLSDPNFNVDQLAKKLYLSQSTLYRKLQALTGESPVEYIRAYRLKRALQLINANFGNVTEVAFKVGFSNTAYFSKCFKEKFHHPPSSFLDSGH